MTIELDSGEKIQVRPIEPEDENSLADAFRTASPETRLHRFFTPIRELPRSELKRMSTIDPAREKCVVGEVAGPAGDRIVCGARYVRLADPAVAEIALTVHDEFQGRGVGTVLLRHLIDLGRADGVRTFTADILASNARMLGLVRKVAPGCRSTLADGVCRVEFELQEAMGMRRGDR